MILHIFPLIDKLEQKIKATRSGFIAAIRPHLYRHNMPAGSVLVELLDVNKRRIAVSESIMFSDIGTAAFFHGYVRFFIKASVVENEYYWIRLVPAGYTMYDSAYVAWCTDYDLRKYDALYSPNHYIKAALDLELFEYVENNRGIS